MAIDSDKTVGPKLGGGVPRRGAIICLFAGMAMLAVAVLAARPTASLQVSGLRAPGTVVGMRPIGGQRKSYKPRVRFKTTNGDIIVFEGVGSYPADYSVGEEVQVMYAADRPTHAMIDRGVRNWLLPAVLALCGLPIALFGARVLIRRGR